MTNRRKCGPCRIFDVSYYPPLLQKRYFKVPFSIELLIYMYLYIYIYIPALCLYTSHGTTINNGDDNR